MAINHVSLHCACQWSQERWGLVQAAGCHMSQMKCLRSATYPRSKWKYNKIYETWCIVLILNSTFVFHTLCICLYLVSRITRRYGNVMDRMCLLVYMSSCENVCMYTWPDHTYASIHIPFNLVSIVTTTL